MRRLWLVLTCLAFLAPALVCAQEKPVPPLPRANLLLQQRWLRIMILDGRLAVTAVSESQPTTINVGNVRQYFNVNLTPDGAVLDYDLTSPAEKLLVHIEGDDQATIRRQFNQPPDPKSSAAGSSPPAATVVEYSQAPQQPVKLSITDNGETRAVQADSLWQLLLFEPELTNRYLVPILEMLRPDWQLMPAAEELKQTLLQAARSSQTATRPRWAELVAQLADERYAVRQRAERQLRAAGRAALPYLQGLQRNDLDAEQWLRVSDIIAASIDDREDTPQRMATRLLDDRALWLSFLADSQESTRRIAAARLSSLLGAQIDFDPAAPLEKRNKQLAALRLALSPKK